MFCRKKKEEFKEVAVEEQEEEFEYEYPIYTGEFIKQGNNKNIHFTSYKVMQDALDSVFREETSIILSTSSGLFIYLDNTHIQAALESGELLFVCNDAVFTEKTKDGKKFN